MHMCSCVWTGAERGSHMGPHRWRLPPMDFPLARRHPLPQNRPCKPRATVPRLRGLFLAALWLSALEQLLFPAPTPRGVGPSGLRLTRRAWLALCQYPQGASPAVDTLPCSKMFEGRGLSIHLQRAADTAEPNHVHGVHPKEHCPCSTQRTPVRLTEIVQRGGHLVGFK